MGAAVPRICTGNVGRRARSKEICGRGNGRRGGDGGSSAPLNDAADCRRKWLLLLLMLM